MLNTSKFMVSCLSIIICLVVLSGISYAEGKWFATDEGYRYYDSHWFSRTATWSGGTDAGGRVHGEGIMHYYVDGHLYSTFKGIFVNGVIQGYGSETTVAGAVYQGEFRNGEWNGKGFFKYISGEIYEGEFANGHPNGKGIFRWNGNVYEGDFVNGSQTGKGVLRWKDGSRYEGEFVSNKFLKGTIYGADGRIVYQGIAESPDAIKAAPPLLRIGEMIKSDEFQEKNGMLVRIEYSKKPTILWFWADFTHEKWLGEMFPVLQSMYESNGDKVNMYTVNFSGRWDKIANVMSRYGCSVPALKSQNNLRYSQGFPCIIILDGEGILRYRHVGGLSLSELSAIVDSL